MKNPHLKSTEHKRQQEQPTINLESCWRHLMSALWRHNCINARAGCCLSVKLVKKGPDALGKFLCILRKNLSSFPWYKCARWIFFPPNFVKHYQTSQAPLSCFGAGQIFVRCENRTDFTICTAWSKEKVFKCAHDYQIENLAETNFVEIFGRAKQILSVQCVRTLILILICGQVSITLEKR